MFNVYADKKNIKCLERARQGYIEAIQEVENYVLGGNSSRIHEEENGHVLCQADSQEQTWHSADRFVYGLNQADALCVAHVIDHQGSQKGIDSYRQAKKTARGITRSDFLGKIHISSRDLIYETQKVADGLASPEHLSRLEMLEKTYKECISELDEKERKEFFREVLEESIKEDGKLSNSERKILQRKSKTDPFRIDMEKMLPEVEYMVERNNPSQVVQKRPSFPQQGNSR